MKKRRISNTGKKIDIRMRRKLVGMFIAVLLALVGLTLRITYINAVSGDMYKKQVLTQTQQQYGSQVLQSKRGDIYDRNGNVLATSNKVYNVILDCKSVNEKEEYAEPTIRALKEVLGIDEELVRDKLTSEETKNSQYQILKKNISMEEKKNFESYITVSEDSDLTEAEQKERKNVKGIWFEEDYLRVYPFESLACDTVGFTFDHDTADWGLEGYYNSTLTGVDGRSYGYFNQNSDVEQTIIEPTNGKSIVSTLDIGAQQIVEECVDAFKEVMGAKNIGVIVENPKTGEILAMDGGDRYDLNHPRDMSSIYTEAEIKAMNDEQTVEALNGMWSNYCVTENFEPGSVVKPIVMASALQIGAIQENDQFVCDGFQKFGEDTKINCAVTEGHGTENLTQVIANSCNDAMMQIGAKMGIEEFTKSQALFNFGTRTGIDLPNEGTGIVHQKDNMTEVDLAVSSFGQGFTCTMIQEINALCSVINGGYYYQPHVVSQILDSDGGVIKNIAPTLEKQTVSSSISADIRSYMEDSVLEGTSHYSKVNGYSSGGKTGTAEKYPRGNGKYLVSFIGFAPVDDPQVVIYVVIDEPKAEDQATSSYPQYVAQAILSKLLPYLNIEPDEAEDGVVPQTELWEKFQGHLEGGDILITQDVYDADGNELTFDQLYDKNGDFIPQKLYDAQGNLIDTSHETEGDYVEDGVSNPDAPTPPEGEETITEMGNDMESDGITNEEAEME